MNSPKEAYHQFTYSSLRPIALSLFVLFTIFSIAHYFMLPDDQKFIMIGVAGVTALIFAVFYFLLRKEDVFFEKATIVCLTFFGLCYGNTYIHMWLLNDYLQTSSILVLHVAAGMLFYPTSLLTAILLISTAIWFIIAYLNGFTPEWIHFIFSIPAAIVLAYIANGVIQKNFKDLLQANVREKEKKKQLKNANSKLEQQSEDLKQNIQDLEIAREAALEASKSRERFLSSMSHELRTPLNAILGLTKILGQNNPREDQADDIETLHFAAERLQNMISDILVYSKIKAGDSSVEKEKTDLSKMLDNLHHFFSPIANEKNIKLLFDQAPVETVETDGKKLEKILHLLLDNALKFTEKGSVQLQITIGETPDGHQNLRFRISDTGIGIPKEKHAQIFEAFIQLSEETKTEYTGNGLGLSIAKSLVALLGGTLNVESQIGKGSDFYFFIPLNQKEENPSKPESSNTQNTKDKASFPESTKVLLVEDDDINLKVISKILRNWKVTHEIVKDGSTACQLIQNKQYDIVLMDLRMPVMNGYEATAEIRKMDDEYFKKIPIIALTASVLMDVEKKIRAAGMNDYVQKPINFDTLHEKMLKALKDSPLKRK